MELSLKIINPDLKDNIEERSNQKLINCYQCGKCSAGCPAVNLMSKSPHGVVRMLQLGLVFEVLVLDSAWYCVSCFTCVSRCPRAIDIAKIMEAIRFHKPENAIINFEPTSLPDELKAKLPQQALVSLWRKSP